MLRALMLVGFYAFLSVFMFCADSGLWILRQLNASMDRSPLRPSKHL